MCVRTAARPAPFMACFYREAVIGTLGFSESYEVGSA